MGTIARDALVVDNLPLVGYLVSEVWGRATHLSRDDLASAGAVALVLAADAYKPELGIPFGAYARRRIIGAFADEMRSADWASRGTRTRIKATMAVQESLTSALGRTPTIDEVAAALGVPRAEAVEALADISRTVTSLDEIIVDVVVASVATPEESVVVAERVEYLRAAVISLPARMRYIVEQIYFEDRSVKDIAEELGVTHSAVSQQRSEAIRLMRDGLGSHYGDGSEAPIERSSRVAPARRAAYLAAFVDSVPTRGRTDVEEPWAS